MLYHKSLVAFIHINNQAAAWLQDWANANATTIKDVSVVSPCVNGVKNKFAMKSIDASSPTCTSRSDIKREKPKFRSKKRSRRPRSAFLDASSHLYKRVRPSVRPSICW